MTHALTIRLGGKADIARDAAARTTATSTPSQALLASLPTW